MKNKYSKVIAFFSEKQLEIVDDWIESTGVSYARLAAKALKEFYDDPIFTELAMVDGRAGTECRSISKTIRLLPEDKAQVEAFTKSYTVKKRKAGKEKDYKISESRLIVAAMLRYIEARRNTSTVGKNPDEVMRVLLIKTKNALKELVRSEYFNEIELEDYLIGKLEVPRSQAQKVIRIYQNTLTIIKNNFLLGEMDLDTLELYSEMDSSQQERVMRYLNSRQLQSTSNNVIIARKKLEIESNG